MKEQEIELQINVNIGNSKYLIKVPKNANRTELIQHFIQHHKLNSKYQQPIIKMVQKKLQEEQKKLNVYQPKPLQPQPAEQQQAIGEKKSEEERSSEESASDRIKQCMLMRIREELQQQPLEDNHNKAVYQQWKQRQKQKTLRQNQAYYCNAHPKPMLNKQSHSPDHFYKKGLEFKQQKELQVQQQFKKHYPFRLTSHTTTSTQQQQLSSRLCKDKKDHLLLTYLSQKTEPEIVVPHKQDLIKQKVKAEDQQLDKVLLEMIRKGQFSRSKDVRREVSPFRKTTIH